MTNMGLEERFEKQFGGLHADDKDGFLLDEEDFLSFFTSELSALAGEVEGMRESEAISQQDNLTLEESRRELAHQRAFNQALDRVKELIKKRL